MILQNPRAYSQTLSQQLLNESQEKLATDARTQGDAVRGAILFSQQNLACANCHAVGNPNLLGPDLTGLKVKLTDLELVEAILLPSKKIEKGFETTVLVTTDGRVINGRILKQTDEEVFIFQNSAEGGGVKQIRKELIEEMKTVATSNMPEKLANQLRNRQEFLDVVRYLMEIQGTNSNATHSSLGGKSIDEELRGWVLVKEFNCEACHLADGPEMLLQPKAAPYLSWSARRVDPEYMLKFIRNPLETKPGTTMPDMLIGLTPDERTRTAEELTHYLLGLSQKRVAFDAQAQKDRAAQGERLFHSVGCVACHAPRDEAGVEMPLAESVPLGNVADKYSLESLIEFLKDPHAARPTGRMPNMQLTHFEATDIGHFLMQARREKERFKWYPKMLGLKGKRHLKEFNCIACHNENINNPTPQSKPLSEVRSDRGCLSGTAGDWPGFSLSEEDRTAIQAALNSEKKEWTLEQQIQISLTGNRCLNCHQRDELGGVSPDRNPHFQTENPNLGPQGRIPPPLTNVGAKLNSDWMRQVMVSGRSIRPYLLTRMPQYGAENIEHLIDLFQDVDSIPEENFAEFQDQKEMRTNGFELVGRDGLNCIACHTFQLKEAATMPAVDLTDMSERLKKNWFYHYMKSPQQLSPNTVMPSFWPGGHSIRKEILDGQPEQQIEAIWQYLLDGRQARQPKGLIIEPIELLATSEAVMLRRSYPEVGKRGIGVGYPHQVNIVFDAEQMRLATVWQGKFADPGGVWRSQGHGRVRPLSRELTHFAKGPDVDDLEHPWIVDEGRPPKHRFRGYRLDNKQRPTFRYEFDGIFIEDRFFDQLDEAMRPFLKRIWMLSTEQARPGVRVRLATGVDIEQRAFGVYSINDKLKIKAPENAVLTRSNTHESLELHLNLPVGKTTVTVDYRW